MHVCVRYQSLALHQGNLSPEVGDAHSDGFSIEAIRGVPHQANPVQGSRNPTVPQHQLMTHNQKVSVALCEHNRMCDCLTLVSTPLLYSQTPPGAHQDSNILLPCI